MALGTLFRLASDGAGYDDYDQNNNAYRNSGGVAEKGTNPATWKTVIHRGTLMSVADKFSKCK